MSRFHPFTSGNVVGALIVGVVAGSVALNLTALLVFALAMAVGAAVATWICSRWPGLSAPAWKLWPIAVLANPVFLAAAAYSVAEYECLIGRRSGWSCLLVDLIPMLAGICAVPPLIGLAARWWASHRRAN
jgi:hypothetical protein